MLGRTASAHVAVVVATMIAGCMKATSPYGAAQIAQLIEHIETVSEWSRGSDRSRRTAWLDRAVAWDLVGAVEMTVAGARVDSGRVDEVMKSGLAELAAGPGDNIATLVGHWRRELGTDSCRSAAATDDDVRWARDRLTMPVPVGAGPDVRRQLTAYAQRARDVNDFVRIDCGGAAHLLVGALGDRLVPVLRT